MAQIEERILTMRQIIRRTLIPAALTLSGIMFFCANAQAATYTVDTTADNAALNACTAAANDCSLRGAITAAGITAESDTINFSIPAGDAGCTAAGVCTITLTGGELIITSSTSTRTVTITNSTGASNLLISGNNQSRVFRVEDAGNLTLNGITVTKGKATSSDADGHGGGIRNDGATVTLINSIVSGNTAQHEGGGIFNRIGGALTVTNSAISGNLAGQGGGGIYNRGTATLTNSIVSENTGGTADNSISGTGIFNNGGRLALTNSTISGNKGHGGVGIFNYDGILTLTSSTISGNMGVFAAGIYNSGTATLTNSTISGNESEGGSGIYHVYGTLNLTSVTIAYNRSNYPLPCMECPGGIYILFGATMNLNNTIVAKNTVASPGNPPDISGDVSSTSSYNLLGNNRSAFGITNGENGNQVGTPTNPIDPLLAPLANNGGATQTHALFSSSPAIDKGNASGTDQRGFVRPVDLNNASYPNAAGGNAADIGAYEIQTTPTAASVSISGRVLTPKNRGLMNALVVLTDQNGATRYARTSVSGYYQFTDIAAGSTAVIEVFSKNYRFPPQMLTINGEIAEINFYTVSP